MFYSNQYSNKHKNIQATNISQELQTLIKARNAKTAVGMLNKAKEY